MGDFSGRYFRIMCIFDQWKGCPENNRFLKSSDLVWKSKWHWDATPWLSHQLLIQVQSSYKSRSLLATSHVKCIDSPFDHPVLVIVTTQGGSSGKTGPLLIKFNSWLAVALSFFIWLCLVTKIIYGEMYRFFVWNQMELACFCRAKTAENFREICQKCWKVKWEKTICTDVPLAPGHSPAPGHTFSIRISPFWHFVLHSSEYFVF